MTTPLSRSGGVQILIHDRIITLEDTQQSIYIYSELFGSWKQCYFLSKGR